MFLKKVTVREVTQDEKPLIRKDVVIIGAGAAGLMCEVVDVAGQLGGYNLQWAWSSGFVAGQYA